MNLKLQIVLLLQRE